MNVKRIDEVLCYIGDPAAALELSRKFSTPMEMKVLVQPVCDEVWLPSIKYFASLIEGWQRPGSGISREGVTDGLREC
jgi:hypothetical protein